MRMRRPYLGRLDSLCSERGPYSYFMECSCPVSGSGLVSPSAISCFCAGPDSRHHPRFKLKRNRSRSFPAGRLPAVERTSRESWEPASRSHPDESDCDPIDRNWISVDFGPKWAARKDRLRLHQYFRKSLSHDLVRTAHVGRICCIRRFRLVESVMSP
jgi:hypothetical protein